MPVLINLAVVVLTAVGTHYGSFLAPLLSVAYFIALCFLAGKLRNKPLYLYGLCLALMYSASMVGAHVVGSDMQQEFYVSRVVLSGGWDFTADYGTQSSTSFAVGWLAPFLSHLFGLIWVYKLVFPAIYALTPVFLYLAFKSQIGELKALYASLFFMAVPVATLEIVQIGKSMVAEPFLALAILGLVSNIKLGWKIACILGGLSVAVLAHYTVGLAAIGFFLVILIVRLFKIGKPATPVWLIGLACVLSISLFAVYYSYANGGVIIKVVGKIIPGYSRIAVETVKIVTDNTPGLPDTANIPPDTNGGTPGSLGYMSEQSPLVKMAIGLDFLEANLAGKLFRLAQFITEMLVVIGGVMWLIGRRGYGREFTGGILASAVILVLCIAVPHFSGIINMTRFYHLALFFVAPLLVMVNYKFVPALLAVYFIFTSGLVFETLKMDAAKRLEVPYGIGFSAERTGIVAAYTQDDVACAEWLASHDGKIVSDYNGYRLMMAYVPINPRLKDYGVSYPETFDTAKEGCYLFVTSWDTAHGSYVTDIRDQWESIGLRQTKPLPVFTLPEVYREGGAIVYRY